MGKFLNSCWWVGVFDAFSSASWWGIWPSKLPTYPEIWLKFFKKSNAWHFAPGGAWVVLESLSTKYRLQTAADHCFHHAIRTRQQKPYWLFSNPENNGQQSVCSLHFALSSLEWTNTLVTKCVHKQSYINYRNGSLYQISTNSGKPTFDIFSFTTSGPTDKL